MKTASLFAPVLAAFLALSGTAQARNIVIFVADGLRYGSVDAENMPNMYRLKTEGVDFTNSHSMFPTITTVNASAIATGHYIGDTGNFGNTLYSGAPLASVKGNPIGGMENPAVLAELNERFGGNYLNEESLMARARAAGFSTAVIGKRGASRIQDVTAAPDGSQTLILDDQYGRAGGFGLPEWFKAKMKEAFVPGEVPAAIQPNIAQEVQLMKATTNIVLPHFKAQGKPFALLYWCRDPDNTQHNAKDSVGEYAPGINGHSARIAQRGADAMLGELIASLKAQGLDKDTDIFVTADHGFLTVSHDSKTSPSAVDGQVKNGFVAADIATGLKLGKISGNMIGNDPAKPDAIVVPNGGSDLIYLPNANARKLARDIVKFLTTQDYVASIFVNDKLGKVPGALAMSDVNLIGSAKTPVPSIYVSFRSFAGHCENALQCTVGVHDTGLAKGQGSHGGLSRAETRNFMAAIGPSFKAGYANPAPISNADIAPTMAHVAGITLAPKGKLTGRVITEALVGGADVSVARRTIQSGRAQNGLRTILNFQQVGEQRYFDAAGFEGRTVGLTPP